MSKQKKLTIGWVMDEVDRITEITDHGDEKYKAGVVLMSSVVVGPDVLKLAEFTGYDTSYLRGVEQKLRDNGIWSGEGVNVSWADAGEDSGIAFNMDILVTVGLLERTKATA